MVDADEGYTAFATAARGFCDWCEGTCGPTAERAAAYWLARLCAEALRLPDPGPHNDWGIAAPPADAHRMHGGRHASSALSAWHRMRVASAGWPTDAC
jgi:hypothetical protein